MDSEWIGDKIVGKINKLAISIGSMSNKIKWSILLMIDSQSSALNTIKLAIYLVIVELQGPALGYLGKKEDSGIVIDRKIEKVSIILRVYLLTSNYM